jgi:hypothetical protein
MLHFLAGLEPISFIPYGRFGWGEIFYPNEVTIEYISECLSFYGKYFYFHRAAEQSVHPTLGILAKSQADFYASAFFCADGSPPPAPSAGIPKERGQDANRWAVLLINSRTDKNCHEL